MLSVSLEDMEMARKDVVEGRLTPAAEVRREFTHGSSLMAQKVGFRELADWLQEESLDEIDHDRSFTIP